MNWSTGFTWLSAWKAKRETQRSDEPDHGDMGTAFGLDASFGSVDDDPSAAAPVNAPASALPWEHRLTRRTNL